jgi:hypothetical protein
VSYHFTACIIACSYTTVKRFFSLGEFAQRTPQRSSIPTRHYSLEPELLEGWGRGFHQVGDTEMRMQRAMSYECQLIRANYEFTRS